jgi:putative nucleotidyltransferase with HDIG domain
MNIENGHSKDSLRPVIEARLKSFPAMPVFVGQITKLVRSHDTDIRLIADRVRLDPGVTANILKLANSAQFGAARSIRSLQDAIVRLGLKQLFQMIVAHSVAPRMAKAMPGYELQPAELLAHSLWTALASEEFCRVLGMETPDMMFTAGLLHDMGKLALDEFVAIAKEDLKKDVHDRPATFDDAEQNRLGISHAEAGAAILDRWNFPEPLVAAARWHHHPDQAGPLSPMVSMVHIAEFLAYEAGVGAGVDGFTYRLSDVAVSRLGLRTKTIEYVASQTLDKMRSLEQLLKE